MKVLKYITQIFAAIAYSFVLACVLGWFLNLIFSRMISLSVGWMIILLLFGGSALTFLIFNLGIFGVYPFLWTNKKNIIATVLSALLMVVLFGNWVISMFKFPHGGGFVPVVTLIVFTILFLELGYIFVLGAIQGYNGGE